VHGEDSRAVNHTGYFPLTQLPSFNIHSGSNIAESEEGLIAFGLSLAACFGWGVADFLGGLKSRQLSIFSVMLASGFIGFGTILAIILFRGVGPPDHPALPFAIVGGFAGIVGMFFLYRGFSIGSMSIVAPISATGVVLPVIVSLAAGDTPTLIQKLGMAAAMTGAVLASWEKKEGGNRGRRLAAGAGPARP